MQPETKGKKGAGKGGKSAAAAGAKRSYKSIGGK